VGGRTSIFLFRLAVDVVAGRVPVIASGHVSDAVHDQADELPAMAESKWLPSPVIWR